MNITPLRHFAGRKSLFAALASAFAGKSGPLAQSPSIPFDTGALDSRLLYTRAGSVDGLGADTPNASSFNSSGNITFAKRHTARLDYAAVDHSARGLIIEAAATNKILNSLDISVGSWSSVGGMTTVANDSTAPDGTVTATKLVSAAATVTMGRQQNTAVNVGPTHEDGIFVKPNGVRWVYLLLFDGASRNVWFDLQNGVLGSADAGVLSKSITAIGNGWFWIQGSWATTGTPGYLSLRFADANSGTSFTGDGVKSVWAWGGSLAQLDSSLSNTLIPTPVGAAAATVTRADEVGKIILTSTATVTFTFDDGSIQTATPAGAGLYTIPTNLNRRWIKRISGPIATPTKKLIFDGDSICAGFLATKPYWAGVVEGCYTDHSVVCANFQRGRDGDSFNYGYSGQPTLIADAPTAIDTQIDVRYENWLIIFAGTNGIWLALHTAAQEYTDFQTYMTARIAAGFTYAKTVIVTMLPRQADAGNEASRVTLNGNFQTFATANGCKIARIDQDANIGVPGSQANATYYNPDQIHPKDAGHAIIATLIEAAIFS